MNLMKWLRKRREQKRLADERAAAEQRQQEQEQDQRQQIVAWGERVIEAGQDPEKVLACGTPPDGAKQFYWELQLRSYSAKSVTPYEIFHGVQQWERLKYEMLETCENGSTVAVLAALSSLAEGKFPFTPSIEYVFGKGADREFLQARYSAKLEELADKIRSAPSRQRAEKHFRQYSKLRRRQGTSEEMWRGIAFAMGYEDTLEVPLPEDWNDFVGRFVQTPLLADFSEDSWNLNEVEVVQLATQAIAQRSLAKAKLALAYAAVRKSHPGSRHRRGHESFRYREVLGDLRVAELSSLIEELHAEKELFVAK